MDSTWKATNARVGITDHAQAELTDVVYVELPKIGTASGGASGQIAVVESVKAASDIYAPVKGTVVEVNEALSKPIRRWSTRAPFGAGLDFRSQDRQRPMIVKKLKDAAAYRTQIG